MDTDWLTPTAAALSAAAVLALVIWLLGTCARLRGANATLSARSREAERATAAKSRFVANMSHELRTPLNVVIGFAELMAGGRTGHESTLSGTQAEHLQMIRDSADHLLTLINEALDLAKIEAGHLRLEPEAVAPESIAAQCLRSLRPLADESLIGLELQTTALDRLTLDPARLRQVILNFLSNAIRFTAPGGRVILALARDGDRLRIEVSDTGLGIAPEDQARMFDEFVQVAGHTRGGSGLGLAVTKQIVEAQGGEVGVKSRLGFGSTFSAWLPWVAAAPASAPGLADPTPARPVVTPGSGPGLGVRVGAGST